MKKNYCFFAAIAAAVVAIASCQKENTPRISDKVIKVKIKSDELPTKAVHSKDADSRLVCSNLLMDMGLDQPISIDLIESEGIMTSYSPATKGSLITTENFNTASVDAYLGIPAEGMTNAQGKTLTPHYIEKGTLSADGSVSKGGEPCYWVNDVDMFMWCYSGADLQSGNTSAYFHHVTPANLADQQDVILSYNKLHYKDDSADFANVLFHHALAAVRYDFRFLPFGTSIRGIELSGVNTQADCIIAAEQDCSITWSEPTDPKSYVVSDVNITSSDEFYPSEASSDKQLYFFIPQTLSSDAKLKMNFYVEGSSEPEKSSVVSLATHKWERAKTYTYRIKAHLNTHDIPVDPITHEIHFNGSSPQSADYADLLLKSCVLRMDWNYRIGNDNRSDIRVVIRQQDIEDIVIYHRYGYNKVSVLDKQSDEHWKEFYGMSKDISGAQHYGECSIIFDLGDFSQLDKTKPFTVVLTYQGGNSGNANWWVSDLDLNIMDNYVYPYFK